MRVAGGAPAPMAERAHDEISRDHEWALVHLFLSAAGYALVGETLPQARNAAAPNPCKSYRLAGAGRKGVQVESIPGWFRKYLILDRLPTRPRIGRPFHLES